VSAGSPVRAYGDKRNDGAVQLSFTLPVAKSPVAIEAAKRFVQRMGIREPYVTLAEAIAPRVHRSSSSTAARRTT
jgi:beta-lysine 5,6-aminomutase beta subunit